MHFAGDGAGRDPEDRHQHQESHRPPETEPDPTHSGAHQQRAEEDEELQDQFEGHA
jgi:hypothetical protein